MKFLGLKRTQGMKNMHLIDDRGYPIHFKKIEDIMEIYYLYMIRIFKKAINKRITDAYNELLRLKNYLALIVAIYNEEIIVIKKTKTEILEQVKKLKLSENLIDKIKFWDCTEEDIIKTRDKIKEQKIKLKNLYNLKPETMWVEKLLEFRPKLIKAGYKPR